MARNGSGTYVVVNSFIAGTTITASDHNENWTDIAAEVSNSLALDGQSVMTGQFKAASGTVLLPGMSFSADLDCGVYRIGANNLGIAVNAAKVLDIATTGLGVTGDASVSGALTVTGVIGGPGSVPLGALIPYIGSAAPTNFLFPFGQAISRTTYATLFALISTTFGVGDGSTTFNIPDLRGRVPFGLDNMGGSAASRIGTVVTDSATIVGATIGSVGGSSTHVLTVAETPAHNHGGATGTLTGTFQGSSGAPAGGNTRVQLSGGSGSDVTANLTDVSFITSATISSQGSGTAHAQLPPAIILPYILRVL